MEHKPYRVKYKAGTDKSILPGLHGSFATMAEAEIALAKCAACFGGGKKNKDGLIIGRAVCGIVVDQNELRLQQEEMAVSDGLGDVELPEPELDEITKLREENARLKRAIEEKGDEEWHEESSEHESSETQRPAKSRKPRATSLTAAE